MTIETEDETVRSDARGERSITTTGTSASTVAVEARGAIDETATMGDMSLSVENVAAAHVVTTGEIAVGTGKGGLIGTGDVEVEKKSS